MTGADLQCEQDNIFTVSLYTKVNNGFGRGGRGARIDKHLIQEQEEAHAQKSGMKVST